MVNFSFRYLYFKKNNFSNLIKSHAFFYFVRKQQQSKSPITFTPDHLN